MKRFDRMGIFLAMFAAMLILGACATSKPKPPPTPTYDLTVVKNGSGTGTVTSDPTGVNCGSGADCTATFDENTSVDLTAAADAGSDFIGWTNCPSASGNVCTVDMTADTTVTATFNLPNTFTLTTTTSGAGVGSVSSDVSGSGSGIDCGDGGTACDDTYTDGTVVTLTPTPNTTGTPSTFAGWSGACTGAGACQVTMDAAKSVDAQFDLQSFTLSVTTEGDGSGTTTSDTGAISCVGAAGCTDNYTFGTTVALTAAPDAGSGIAGWQGCATITSTTVTNDTCTVTVNAATNVKVAYKLDATATTDVSVSIAASSDDAEEFVSNICDPATTPCPQAVQPPAPAGTVYTTSGDLELTYDDGYNNETPATQLHTGTDQIVGLRFAGVNVPQGAYIVSAQLVFTARTTSSATENPDLTLESQASGDAATFVEDDNTGGAVPASFGISNRATNANSVLWTVDPWTEAQSGPETTSPNIAALVQPIVNRSDWAANQAMVFVIQGPTTAVNVRNAVAFDETLKAGTTWTVGDVPVLQVSYYVP